MSIEKSIIDPSYKKDNGAWALDTQQVLPEGSFHAVEQAIIYLPPNVVAGNHRHERREALLGIGPGAVFLWQDEGGTVHQEPMNPDGELYLFSIPPYVPHAVHNQSAEPVVLYEYFDDVFRGVEPVDLLQQLDSPQ